MHVHTSCVFFSNIALCTFVSCSRTSSFACSACRCASHSAFRLCIIKSICRINSINSDSQLLKSVPPNLHLTSHLEKRPLLSQRFQLTINVRFVIPETTKYSSAKFAIVFLIKKMKANYSTIRVIFPLYKNQSTTPHRNATYPPDRFRSAHRPVNGGSIPFIYTCGDK